MRIRKLMTPLAVFLGLCAAAEPAGAQPRPFAPKIACGSLKSLVDQSGGVVLQTSPTTYDRYVATSRSCVLGEINVPAWIRSADAKKCFVGYTCEPYSRDDWR